MTDITQWRAVLKMHSAADAFPTLSEKELKELAGDIQRNGLQTKIVLWAPEAGAEPQLLDGRNRLDALALIGRIVVDEHGRLHEGIDRELVIGGDPVKLAYSLNVHRRHLTAEKKRELIAALIKDDPNKSDRQISKEAGASPTFVGKVRAEKEATGDVSTVDTRTDTKGRKQPARKSPRAKTPKTDPVEGNGADPEATAEARKAEYAKLGAGDDAEVMEAKAAKKPEKSALDVLRFLDGPGRRSAQPPGWVRELERYALGRLSVQQLIDILAHRIAGNPAAAQALEALRAAVNTGIPDFLERTRTATPAVNGSAS